MKSNMFEIQSDAKSVKPNYVLALILISRASKSFRVMLWKEV